MNNFNNAIQVITTSFNVTADIRNDVARMQVPPAAWRDLLQAIRKNTGRVWWTAEDDIINVYSDKYDFVMSKRTGRITITNMFFDVFDLEAGGLLVGTRVMPQRNYAIQHTNLGVSRSCSMTPAMAAPYGTQGKEIASYMDAAAVKAISSFNERAIALAKECIKCGFTYALYCDYMEQFEPRKRVTLSVTERKYDSLAMEFAREIANLDSGTGKPPHDFQ